MPPLLGDKTQGILQAHVTSLHQVGNDDGGTPRYARVAVNQDRGFASCLVDQINGIFEVLLNVEVVLVFCVVGFVVDELLFDLVGYILKAEGEDGPDLILAERDLIGY